MALPSTRRPKELDEEEATVVREVKRESLVLRISRNEIFKLTMKDWYETLTDKQKSHLTPVHLKRKAVNVCHTNQMVYDNLPLNWVEELKQSCGLKLYQKPRPLTHVSRSGPGEFRRNKDAAAAERRKKRYYDAKNASAAAVGVSSYQPLVPKKRFIDLSGDPPPPLWMKSYAEGTELPRVLQIYSTEDTNILYYDYDPKLKDSSGKEVKLQPKPRVGLEFIQSLTTYYDDDERGTTVWPTSEPIIR